jgi:hypothetical protein
MAAGPVFKGQYCYFGKMFGLRQLTCESAKGSLIDIPSTIPRLIIDISYKDKASPNKQFGLHGISYGNRKNYTIEIPFTIKPLNDFFQNR